MESVKGEEMKIGGEGGIRTLGTVQHRTLTFQASPFNHSGTSPYSWTKLYIFGLTADFNLLAATWHPAPPDSRIYCDGHLTADARKGRQF